MRHLRMGLVGLWSLVCLMCSGAWAWQIDINGTANRGEQANAIAVDGAGDVVAAGWTNNRGTLNDFTVVKVAGASGAELWRVVIAGSGRGSDLAIAVAVDGAGDVVAAGWTDNDTSGTGLDFLVVKLAGSTGTELWRYVLNPADGDDEAYAVAVDSAGDVVAAGYTSNTGAWDFTVVKLAGSTGAERWRYMLNPADGFDLAFAVTVDAAGDVVAAGATQTPDTSTDFTVVKVAGSSGAERWRYILNGPPNSFDEAYAVAVDGAGDVVAAGGTSNSGTDFDFLVIKLAGPSGVERWRYVLNGTANSFDAANAVAVDGAGDVVAAGGTSNTDTNGDFSVVKLAGPSGAERWRAAIAGSGTGADEARAVTVDGVGDVVAAGWTDNTDTGGDFTVVKLAGPSGVERWRAAIDGTGTGDDQAWAVAVDGAGDVVAAGGTSNTGTPFLPRPDFTVVKLSGTDGGDF